MKYDLRKPCDLCPFRNDENAPVFGSLAEVRKADRKRKCAVHR